MKKNVVICCFTIKTDLSLQNLNLSNQAAHARSLVYATKFCWHRYITYGCKKIMPGSKPNYAGKTSGLDAIMHIEKDICQFS